MYDLIEKEGVCSEGNSITKELHVCGCKNDPGGEGSEIILENELNFTTTLQEDTRHINEHRGEKEVEEKEGETPQEEEDLSALTRVNRKGLLAAKAGNNECISVNEKMLFSMHGLSPTLPVSCDFCPMEFQNFTEFDAHMVTHKECRFFSCQLCSNTYLSWGNLVAHRKACHRGQILSCDACGQRKFHPGLGCVNFPVEGSPIGCEECGEGFSTIMQLYRHYRLHGTHQFMPHKGKLTKVPERSAVSTGGSCHMCSEVLTHKQVAVDESSHTDSISHSELCNVVEQTCLHSASHTCPVCGKVTLKNVSSQQHCATHFPTSGLDHHFQEYNQESAKCDEMTEYFGNKHASPDEMRTCSICGHSWLSGRELLVHYKACHRDTARHQSKVNCPICHKMFSQLSALGRHLKLHNPLSRHHICELCGEIIVHRDQVLIHARQHYGAELPETYKKLECLSKCEQRYRQCVKHKSFICEYCGRDFNRKLNLQLHVRRHTGEKPYGCQLCGKAFYTNQQLAIHVRCHTGERPYTCSICSKSFTGPTALYIHRKLHDKVKHHLCPHCGKRFFWRSAFVGHIRRHTGERPYCCKVCGKTFILKGKLNLHLKKHAVLACLDCGEKFENEAELNAHRNEQCCVTMMTFVEEGPSGEKDTRIILVNSEDLEQNSIYIDDTEVVQLVV